MFNKKLTVSQYLQEKKQQLLLSKASKALSFFMHFETALQETQS